MYIKVSFKLILAVWLVSGFSFGAAAAVVPFDVLADKAQRFFNNKEWASAEAMYQLMTEERPGDAVLYGSCIVTAGLRNNTEMQMRFLDEALKAYVNQDSLFSTVEKLSFSVGNSTLYEDFLKTSVIHVPWLRRPLESRLLSYYCYRRNAPMMVDYSLRMLEGMPDNTSFMLTLAQGYLVENNVEKAISTYQQIVDKSPECYEALLYLGLYYADRFKDGDYESVDYANKYLGRANKLRPTPYVENLLKEINTHR